MGRLSLPAHPLKSPPARPRPRFLCAVLTWRRLAKDLTAVSGVLASCPQGERLRVVADPLAELDLRRFAATHAASLTRAKPRLEDAILAWSLPTDWHRI